MSYSSAVIADSPLRYWRLNEASGNAVDEIAPAELLTLNGGLTYQVDGAIAYEPTNKAISFDGTADYGEHALAADTDVFTLEFWLKIDSYTDSGHLVLTIDPLGALGDRFYIDADDSGGVVVIGMITVPANLYWVDSMARPSAGVWHHWVVVCNRAVPINKAYIDGVPQSMSTVLHEASAYGNFTSPPTFYLMTDDASTKFFAGDVDEFAIYNTELSAARVLAHYNEGASSRTIRADYRTFPKSKLRRVVTV